MIPHFIDGFIFRVALPCATPVLFFAWNGCIMERFSVPSFDVWNYWTDFYRIWYWGLYSKHCHAHLILVCISLISPLLYAQIMLLFFSHMGHCTKKIVHNFISNILQYDDYVIEYHEICFLTAVWCLTGSCECGSEMLGSIKGGTAWIAEWLSASEKAYCMRLVWVSSAGGFVTTYLYVL